ncbi:MAG: hypothetical protein V4543_11390 [Bacteroidota bacterium]
MKKLLLLLTCSLIYFNTGLAQSQTKTQVTPKGVYAEIDIADCNKTILALQGPDAGAHKAAAEVLKTPNKYNPPVIFELSRLLFKDGKKQEASYWFYVAQLRARYDANLCTDASARSAAGALTGEYGPEINIYATKDVVQLEKTVKKVCEFVRKNNEEYDHRWINLHGLSAMSASLGDPIDNEPLSLPKKKWSSVKKKTIDDYYSGFITYSSVLKKSQK